MFESQKESKKDAMYAARKVLEALGSMFENAKGVMEWLNECAREIAYIGAAFLNLRGRIRSHSATADNPVSWRTPAGLPVVQVPHNPAAPAAHPGRVGAKLAVPAIPEAVEARGADRVANLFCPVRLSWLFPSLSPLTRLLRSQAAQRKLRSH